MQSEQQTETKKPTSTSDKKKVKKVKVELSEQSETQVNQSVTPVTQVTPIIQQTTSSVVQIQQPVVQVIEQVSEVTIQDMDSSSLLETMNSLSDKFNELSKFFKDKSFSKDERSKVDMGFKKLFKSVHMVQSSYIDNLSKQVSVLEKSSSSKSGGSKKMPQDKAKSAIHKKLPVQQFLLNFMKLEPLTHVSRSAALTAITGFVKQEKVKNPDINVLEDKRSFKLIGELKVLFDGIEDVMKSKGLLTEKEMPKQIKYTQIMEYMTHCFIKTEDVTEVSVL